MGEQNSIEHGSHWQVCHGTPGLPQNALGGGSAQAIEKSIRAIGRHRDQVCRKVNMSFQRSSVSRTPGKSCHSTFALSVTWSVLSLAPAIKAILRACANATSLASEKSDG
jgi:hypothetical protein